MGDWFLPLHARTLRMRRKPAAAPERDLHLALIRRRLAGHLDEHDHGNPEEVRPSELYHENMDN